MVRPIPAEIHAVFPYTAKNLCPTLFHTATVKPKRRGRSLLYRTPLRFNLRMSMVAP